VCSKASRDIGAQHGAGEQRGAYEQEQGAGKQQHSEQHAVSSRAGMHAPMRVRVWGQPEGACGRQPPDVGPVAEAGALECCRFLSIRFGRWRA
jgi:hypothetical protein